MSDVLPVSIDVSAVPDNPGGAGRYTIELLRALSFRDDVRLSAIARRGDIDRWSTSSNVAVEARVPDRRPLRLAWEQLRMPSLVRNLDVAVHHSPHYTMPEASRLPVVVTVHDMTFFDHPEWHQRTKVLLFRRAIRVAARHATAIVCVSQTTADELRERCDPVVPVQVIPHGVDHERFRPTELTEGDDAKQLANLGLTRPFFAFVGTVEPRKNVPALVQAFDRVAKSHPELDLVIAGANGWGTEAVDAAIAQANHGERVKRLGYIEDSAITAVLRNARAVAYPSLAEGFGLPALETLSCGGVVITTKNTAMAEVVGNAGILVSAGSVDELAEALSAVADGTADLERRQEEGVRIASAYTWERAADEHVALYRRATPPGPTSGS